MTCYSTALGDGGIDSTLAFFVARTCSTTDDSMIRFLKYTVWYLPIA
jgi:hypothetical protein